MKALGIQITPSGAIKQCIECGSNTSRQGYHPNGRDQCSNCYLKKYQLTYKVSPEVIAARNVKRNETRRQSRSISQSFQAKLVSL